MSPSFPSRCYSTLIGASCLLSCGLGSCVADDGRTAVAAAAAAQIKPSCSGPAPPYQRSICCRQRNAHSAASWPCFPIANLIRQNFTWASWASSLHAQLSLQPSLQGRAGGRAAAGVCSRLPVVLAAQQPAAARGRWRAPGGAGDVVVQIVGAPSARGEVDVGAGVIQRAAVARVEHVVLHQERDSCQNQQLRDWHLCSTLGCTFRSRQRRLRQTQLEIALSMSCRYMQRELT